VPVPIEELAEGAPDLGTVHVDDHGHGVPDVRAGVWSWSRPGRPTRRRS
jgi:hypothetical protein